VEFSGNVNLDTIEDIGKIGVDVVSVVALTHSVKALDISMKNLRNI
ncbi:nicotinate-nucleotide diphosphorylase (carboxylating), partial [Clostridioides difficile]|nr:nicotinate-nucleotide diphosphorylase (carboxylating) [Clostridioides difficile]